MCSEQQEDPEAEELTVLLRSSEAFRKKALNFSLR